ncbi:MAG: hypothetical protein WCI39_00895 [Gallionellaceae bacterium]
MNIFKKIWVSTFMASIFLVAPLIASAAADPYTTKEIINKLSVYLDDNAEYLPNVASESARRAFLFQTFDEERTRSFNATNFGNGRCPSIGVHFARLPENLHSRMRARLGDPGGDIVFFNALEAVFEGDQEVATSNMQAGMALMERDVARDANCQEALDKFKEFINTITQAAPDVLAEKKKQAQAKQLVAQKAVDEDRAKTLAWMAQQQKLEACQSSDPYKLYQISINIENNQKIAQQAQQEINRQKEGAKISGYVDKNVMYQMGNRVAEVNSVNARNFQLYKQLGGTAKSVDAIRSIPDPCSM